MENNMNGAPVPAKMGFWKMFFITIVCVAVLFCIYLVMPFQGGPTSKLNYEVTKARSKGADAALKGQIAQTREAAEIYYDSNNASYLGVCKSSQISTILTYAKTEAFNNDVVCFDTTKSYALGATLQDGANTICVNNTGVFADNLPGKASDNIKAASATCK